MDLEWKLWNWKIESTFTSNLVKENTINEKVSLSNITALHYINLHLLVVKIFFIKVIIIFFDQSHNLHWKQYLTKLEPSQLTATNWPRTNWPRSNDFVTCFRHWFRRSDFVTKWGFGQDGSGDSKNLFRIALPSQSALFAVSLFTVSSFADSLSRTVVVDPTKF